MFNLPIYILALCTAYTSSFDECGNTDGITASGTKATINRTVAADDLPLGTRIRINGQEYIVEDRFGGGYKNRIDIYVDTKEKAYQYGRQYNFIEIIKEENNYAQRLPT